MALSNKKVDEIEIKSALRQFVGYSHRCQEFRALCEFCSKLFTVSDEYCRAVNEECRQQCKKDFKEWLREHNEECNMKLYVRNDEVMEQYFEYLKIPIHGFKYIMPKPAAVLTKPLIRKFFP